ncbi:hypothetical protein CLAFUW4_13731 [Fulvia fulva]|uniref:Uncharacterized protein n=1 Tax=Passalora fulva TaxID=5499 RepID=A0A9Q8PKR8_PASFU|nr:uncharacterized protein CLAFUR5_13579 [Fulvia fulva]KAK4610151.1 hypothetical protein CLAFUR4_13734 [Fulvia fulva]KAK4611039.1 hypothetical protein CLAFUR0_13738 [Fulvia fulva]UJO24321.1 hypothetical protein CLAFUR5_13579 [Fulvia fulva]WPV22162.1 hypothetical protein CLAFUW4_13731 [Fulvia fulva]WPV36840.1 hypothetical protein CLAFUW7_13739 [Fulvia fulva]
MATITWGTIQSLLLFFGPWLLPRILAFYRSLKNRPASQIRPLPTKTSYALAILFISGTLAFLSTLPAFAPENIFRLTQSRLHTNGGVLLTRLATVRSVTAPDEKLRAIFDAGGLEARLLYARYGPQVLLDCTLAKAGDIGAERAFLIYALPSLLTPHLLHLFALGIATSGLLSGKEGARWRTMAIITGLILAVVEIYIISNYNDRANARSVRVNDIDFLHWKMAVYRGLAIAGSDGVLGWVIWLQATGRAFITPPTPGEKILETGAALEKVFAKTRGIGVVRNAALRDGGMRKRVDEYWFKESEVMKDVLEDAEVLEAQRNALRMLDTVRAGRDAEAFIDAVLGPEMNSAAQAHQRVMAR